MGWPTTHRRDVLRFAAWAAALAGLPAGALGQSLHSHKIVGLVMPTTRPGTVIELIQLLPKGVGLLPVYLAFHEGTEAEFKQGFGEYEKQIAILADVDQVDVGRLLPHAEIIEKLAVLVEDLNSMIGAIVHKNVSRLRI